eukprot:gene8472-8655_t
MRAELLTWLSVLLLIVQSVTTAAPTHTNSCPGTEEGSCGRSCQLYVCKALTSLYNSTQGNKRAGDAEAGWVSSNRAGWAAALEQGCEAYLDLNSPTAQPEQPPRYCREFYGVKCCSGTDSSQVCFFNHALTGVSLPLSHINGSLNDPRVFGAVKTLDSCGLQVLDFEQGRMSGSLTAEWGQLTRLKRLVLTGNWITGSLPPELGNMTSLEVLLLDNNFLTGTLPKQLTQLKRLQRLNLAQQAYLTATTGESLLDNVDLAGGGISGTIPAGLSTLPDLIELNLGLNRLTGTLPSPVCLEGESKLQVFIVRSNFLEGSCQGLAACPQLRYLDVALNSLTGHLPASPAWQSLALYLASSNGFEGNVPLSLFSLPFLTWLDISSNKLTGGVNNSLGLMSYISTLDLSNNRFSGTVPLGLFYISSLRKVDMSRNRLTGTVPWTTG